ncbi:hypothetical protein [Mariniradius saccharolyticus]|nr:hypothetical protein [Mariniradius saccharolyticus]
MNTEIAKLHAQALSNKRKWLQERKNLGMLLALRTDWMVLKFTRLEQSLREQMYLIADTEISNNQLYHDLDLIQQQGA